MSFESLALATGEGARQSMSTNIRYTDEPLGRLKVVRDFLPRPEDLVFRDEGVKVTIAMSKPSFESVSEEARTQNAPSQRMTRRMSAASGENVSRLPAARWRGGNCR